MRPYLNLMQDILDNGVFRGDRTGVGTQAVFGRQMRFDLSEGFPLVTTKRIHMKSVIHELLWFLMGTSNIKYLQDNKVRIWDPWADKDGELGPVYGVQWREWPAEDNNYIDQIATVEDQIKNNPTSRRLIVSAWNVAEIEEMALPPCHMTFQFFVANDRLSCQMYQRSADVFLGVPFNIASYSLLTMMMAQVTGLKPGEFIHDLGDTHLYLNHLVLAEMQIERKPYPLPQMLINKTVESIFDFKYGDFELVNYEYHPHIKAEIAV